ncbi:MAG: ATP-binding protein [Anaerolineae bacterium]
MQGKPRYPVTLIREMSGKRYRMARSHTNITGRKRAEQVVQEAQTYAESILDTVREPFVVLDADLRVKGANRPFYQTFQVSPQETENHLIYNLMNGEWNIPRLRSLLEDMLTNNTQIQGFEVDHEFARIGHKKMLLNARRIHQEGNRTQMILLAIGDITERKQSELRALFEAGRLLTSPLDLPEILDRLTEITYSFLKMDVVRIWLLDETGGALVLYSQTGVTRNEVDQHRQFAPGEGLIGLAMVQGHPLAVPDVQTDPRAKNRAWFEAEGFLSYLGVPLLLDETPVGALACISRTRRDWPAQEVALAQALANCAAVAIRNAHLHEQVRRHAAELEQRVAERTAAAEERAKELTRSNAELEQFAYVASHDLQEPLRMVASYTQLLRQRYKGKLDSDANEFIVYAVDGANRMRALINDLLAYSRVGTRSKPFEPTNCEAVFHQAVADIKVTIEENGAMVTHEPLPTVMADASQLGQVFRNLIGNAIKFHGQEPPCVHVAAERKGKEYVFGVRDNGIGIEPEYTERIFLIFQRLHTRGDYPGTGIGLAICKKIIERHGGRIWVESEPGKGTTFYFTIPIDQRGKQR